MWLEKKENEENIDNRMVSLFRYLHHVTNNCANINNTDQIFHDFANKHLLFDDVNYEHLPIPVYLCIKPSVWTEFILNILSSLGRFSKERDLLFNETVRCWFCNAKLIWEEYDTESLKNSSDQVMNIFVNNQLVLFRKGQRTIDSFII